MKRLAALGPDVREMARLAAPIVLINVGVQLMGVTDALMVGRLGGAAIAAVALGNFYFWNASVFGIGLLFALDPVVSQAVGAHDHEGVARGVQRGVILALIVSTIVSLMLLPGEALLGLLEQPAEVVPSTAEYARRRALGVLPFFLFTVWRQTLQAMGPVKPILWAALIGNVVNIIANWFLIFGNMGAPKLGVNGSGYATALAMWVMMLSLLTLGWKDLRTALVPWRRASIAWAPVRRLLFIGAPIGVQWFFESFAFGLTALFMGWMGTPSLAGHEIALNMASLTYMIPLGFSGAAAAIVGRAVGRGDIAAAKRDAVAAILCSVGVMCISATGFVFAPEWLARRYTGELATLSVAVSLIPLAGAFQLFDGAQAVIGGVLRGTGDTRIPAILHLLAFWGVGVPLGAYLGFYTSLREQGFWWGLVAGLGAAAILQGTRLFYRFRGPILRLKTEAGDTESGPGDNPLPVG
ncbi:MAG: MATE family efflux transporter [Phycisphaerae bacterium]|nr:MATE family efflux transporter [Gemmatimonadaceae bacterium]